MRETEARPPVFTVAVIATRHRPRELARLLRSLEAVSTGLGGVVVVDNGRDPATWELVANTPLDAHYRAPERNLGCGGGLALGEKAALEIFAAQLTHLWILDDDAVVPPDILEILTDEMRRGNADAACPMVVDESGGIGWFPGLLDAGKFRVLRAARTPAAYLAQCGPGPVLFSWSTGVSLLVTRRAVEQLGFHRGDYWVRGEDLEWSLRITHRFRGIFVPRATVRHLPPPVAEHGGQPEMLRHAAMLQNIVYTSVYLPHGRRILHTIPGNFRRFLRTWPLRDAAAAAAALWRGGARGIPAGLGGAESFRARFGKMTHPSEAASALRVRQGGGRE